MKANEAPEKLYLLPNGLISYCRNTDEDVEYTSTDAFIEKAVSFLSNESNIPLWSSNNGNFGCNTVLLIKNFRKYMEGE